jgi:AraC-like DNA-binding protein
MLLKAPIGEAPGKSTDRVPSQHFDYRNYRPDERLAAFRQLVAPLYNVWALGDPAEFEVDATGHRVGELIFHQVRFSPARFRRGPEHLRGSNEDFLVLEALLTGEQRLVTPHAHLRLLEGHVYLRDWAHEFEAYATAMRLNSIMIPRHLLKGSASMSPRNSLVSWALTEGHGRLLSMLWSQLLAEFAEASPAEAQNLCDAFLGFVDGLLGEGSKAEPLPTLGAMQQYLNSRLRGDVGIEKLCAHFHVSRSKVYRLFEPLGGVCHYITRSRLERCYTELLTADPSRVKVADVASSWGFTEASSFTRSFRSRFGTPPSQVLGRGFGPDDKMPPTNCISGVNLCRDYMAWLQASSGRRPTNNVKAVP